MQTTTAYESHVRIEKNEELLLSVSMSQMRIILIRFPDAYIT